MHYTTLQNYFCSECASSLTANCDYETLGKSGCVRSLKTEYFSFKEPFCKGKVPMSLFPKKPNSSSYPEMARPMGRIISEVQADMKTNKRHVRRMMNTSLESLTQKYGSAYPMSVYDKGIPPEQIKRASWGFSRILEESLRHAKDCNMTIHEFLYELHEAIAPIIIENSKRVEDSVNTMVKSQEIEQSVSMATQAMDNLARVQLVKRQMLASEQKAQQRVARRAEQPTLKMNIGEVLGEQPEVDKVILEEQKLREHYGIPPNFTPTVFEKIKR